MGKNRRQLEHAAFDAFLTNVATCVCGELRRNPRMKHPRVLIPSPARHAVPFTLVNHDSRSVVVVEALNADRCPSECPQCGEHVQTNHGGSGAVCKNPLLRLATQSSFLTIAPECRHFRTEDRICRTETCKCISRTPVARKHPGIEIFSFVLPFQMSQTRPCLWS